MLFIFLMFFAPPSASCADLNLRVQVATEANIYVQPDYKAQVVERVQAGTVVFASTQKQLGVSGMGVFYQVKTASGKTGYIADSDLLAPTQEGLELTPPPPKPAPTARPVPRKVESSISLGPSLAGIDYAEKVNGVRRHGNQLFFGMRRTGSSRRPNRIRSDINLLLSPVPPTFLGGLGAYGPAKGFITLLDVQALWPFYESKNSSLGLEAGALLAYSNYSATLDGGSYRFNKLRPGGVCGLSYGYNFSAGILRFDFTSFFESTVYYGGMATFQFKL